MRNAFLIATILLTASATQAGEATAQGQNRSPETDFRERQKAIKERFEKNRGKTQNAAVHNPPMIEAEASDLDDDEPVIGVSLNDDARAYPLTMLFGGGGIFELLNDTCGGHAVQDAVHRTDTCLRSDRGRTASGDVRS